MKTKIPKRTYTLGVRLKPQEEEYLRREADERGQRLSEYIRNVLLSGFNYMSPSVGK